MLAIQEYIKCFNSKKEAHSFLDRKCNIEVKLSKNIFLSEEMFQYKTRTWYTDCRLNLEAAGLILNTKGEIVCLPPMTPKICPTWHDERIVYGDKSYMYEVEDGLPFAIYHYKNMWHIATVDSVDATMVYDQGDYKSSARFEVLKLFNRLFGRWEGPFEAEGYENRCYFFELVGTGVEKIKKYPKKNIILMAMTDKAAEEDLGLEDVIEFSDKYGFEKLDFMAVSNPKQAHNFHILSDPYSKASVLVDENGNKFQKQQKLYSALRIAKMVERLDTMNVATQLVNVMKYSRDIETFDKIKRDFKEYAAVLDILMSTRRFISDKISKIFSIDKTQFAENISRLGPEFTFIRPGLMKLASGQYTTAGEVVDAVSAQQFAKFAETLFPSIREEIKTIKEKEACRKS